MKKHLIFGAISFLAVVGLQTTDWASARERNVSITGAGDRTASRNVQAGVTEEGYNRTVTNQGPIRSGSHSTSLQATGEGTVSGTTTVQSPTGTSSSYSSTTQGGATGTTGQQRTTTVTGAGGGTASRDVEAGMTEDGYQRNISATGPAGRSSGRTTTVKRQ